MKRGILIIFLVSFLIVMPFVSASIFTDFFEWTGITGKVVEGETSTSNECYDSDGGKNYYVKSITTGYDSYGGDINRIATYTDRCDSNQVVEFYCEYQNDPHDGLGYVTISNYPCQYGCSDGACIKKEVTCTDSDGGLDYYEKGKCIDNIESTEKNPIWDSCGGDGITLYEFSCDESGMCVSRYPYYKCPNGCQDGACVQQNVTIGCNSNRDCSTDQFCEFPTGTCEGPGKCISKPEICTLQYSPVCGCDGRTYGNDCSRKSAGVSKDYDGACIKQNQTCTDSDGGKNYYIEGECKSGSRGQSDVCSYTLGREGVLKEAYCNSQGSCEQEEYICASGQICRAGKCMGGDINLPICIETDSGDDPYVAGEIRSKNNVGGDDTCYISQYPDRLEGVLISHCSPNQFGMEGMFCGVYEYYCNSKDYSSTKFVECPNGCKDGACVKGNITCTDSDGGKDYYVKGIVNDVTGSNIADSCQISQWNEEMQQWEYTDVLSCAENTNSNPYSSDTLAGSKEDRCVLSEFVCQPIGHIAGEGGIYCPNGCQDGACIGEKEIIIPEEPTEMPDKDEDDQIIYICSGCEIENKCYPFGYRKNGEYCNEFGEFTEYKSSEGSCENNFECESNLCIDNKCVSGNLWQKVLNFFKRLFGND